MITSGSSVASIQFQSLIGILVDFNQYGLEIHKGYTFQSLIGILVDFNEILHFGESQAIQLVSIPDRDFSRFQQLVSETLTVFSFQGTFSRS